MENLVDRWLASFALHSEFWLSGGLAAMILFALWVVLRGQRQQQVALRHDLSDQLQVLSQPLNGLVSTLAAQGQMQHQMQDKVNGLEKALTQDAARLRLELAERLERHKSALQQALSEGQLAQQNALAEHREVTVRAQQDAMAKQQETLATTMQAMGKQVHEGFKLSSDQLAQRVESLTRTTDERLKSISGQVEKRLSEGFEKTTETFTRVLEHLSRIDEAQKKITELSGNVVSLQEVLTDKRSRGAFGEVQLATLVRNVMPEGSFQMQQTLSNGKRVDCLLQLPDPTGNVPIDAKFPLESYQKMLDIDLPEGERKTASTQFRKDIRKHITDIASKYLIAGETADGAVMFIPAEAIFAEIHAHFPDLVECAQQSRVWMVSPTTLMAVLTTARAVLKDDATRKQVHVIQDHLRRLGEDFGRFQDRMDKLATHIRQANTDVEQVNTSARKIVSRFGKIEDARLDEIGRED